LYRQHLVPQTASLLHPEAVHFIKLLTDVTDARGCLEQRRLLFPSPHPTTQSPGFDELWFRAPTPRFRGATYWLKAYLVASMFTQQQTSEIRKQPKSCTWLKRWPNGRRSQRPSPIADDPPSSNCESRPPRKCSSFSPTNQGLRVAQSEPSLLPYILHIDSQYQLRQLSI
jgi:hypothetical protein